MKYLFFLWTLILTCSICNAQTHREKKFIRFAIGQENIIYEKKINPGRIKELEEGPLKQDTLFELGDYTMPATYKTMKKNVFILTDMERVCILQQLDKMKGFTLKNNVVKKSLAVDYDELKTYKKQHNGQLSYNPDDYKNGWYAFTRPIFFRNNKFCLFYIVYNGGGKLLLYVKENGKWKLKLTPYYWVS